MFTEHGTGTWDYYLCPSKVFDEIIVIFSSEPIGTSNEFKNRSKAFCASNFMRQVVTPQIAECNLVSLGHLFEDDLEMFLCTCGTIAAKVLLIVASVASKTHAMN